MSDRQMTTHIAVIGPPGAGKTAYLERLISDEFVTEHVTTEQPSEREVEFRYADTNTPSRYDVTFVCHEMHHLQPYDTLFYGVLVLMDPTSPTLESEITEYLREIVTSDAVSDRLCVCFCATKTDLKSNEEQAAHMFNLIKRDMCNNAGSCSRQHKYFFYQISAKSNYNFEKPWTNLLQKLTGIPTLCMSDSIVQVENVRHPRLAQPARKLLVSENAVPVPINAIACTRLLAALIVGPPKAGATAYLNRLRGIDLDTPTEPGLHTYEFDMYTNHADGKHERVQFNVVERNGVSLQDMATVLWPNLIIILIDPQSPKAVADLTELVTWAYWVQSERHNITNPRIAVCLSRCDIIAQPERERMLMECLDRVAPSPYIGRFVVSAMHYDSLLMPLLYGAQSSAERSDVQIGRLV